MTFAFSIPIPDMPTRFDSAPQPSQLKSYLTTLPMGAPNEALGELINTITAYNAGDMEAPTRYKVADVITPVVRECTTTLADKYRHSGIPLSEQRYAWQQSVQQLFIQMAGAYQIIASQMSQLPIRSDSQNLLLSQSIRKAIIWLARSVVNAYLVYLPDPQGVWRVMHQLYGYAEGHGVENMVLEKSDHKSSALKTIQHVYLRVALLSVANPYHLMQGESSTIYRYLNQWAAGCRVIRLTKTQIPGGNVLIDLKSDQAPHFTYCPEKVDMDYVRTIETTRLLSRFKEALAKFTRLHGSSEVQVIKFNERLQRNMLFRLQKVWQGRYQRTSSRRPNKDKIQLATGLSACHYFNSGQQEFLPEIDEIRLHRPQGSDSGLTLVPKEYAPWREEKQQDSIAAGIENTRISVFGAEASIWNKIYANKTQGRTLREEIRQYFSTSEWSLVNTTEEGMGLKCHAPSSHSTRVGDVVSFRTYGEEGGWRLGEIRWMLDLRIEGVTMGIQYLTDTIQSVAVRAVAGAGSGGEYFRGLIINVHHEDAPSSIDTLLTPAAIYDVGTQLVLNRGNKMDYVRLSRLVHTTNSFSLFQYELIEIPSSEAALIKEVKDS